MKNFSMHDNAKANFDLKANHLIGLIKEIPPRPQTDNFDPDHHVDAEINLDDQINSISMAYLDPYGKEIGRAFHFENKRFGLIKKDYSEFIKLSQSIQKTKILKPIISLDFVKNELFAWLVKSFKEQSKTSFFDDFLLKASESCESHEIWIPILHTVTVSEFSLGRVNFKPLSNEQLDLWFRSWNENADFNDSTAKYQLDLRRKYQGYMAGVYKCNAESIRANELAYDYVAQSLAVLRLLSSANHIPGLICGAYELGRLERSKEYFIISGDRNSCRPISELLDLNLRWTIKNADIEFIKSPAFEKYHVLLNCDSPNEFQKKLLDALLVYSRNTISRDLYEKILYILIALESILLKNDSEPIMQNIADRMAFAIGKNTVELLKIVHVVKAVYKIRSKYIHHGIQDIEDLGLIRAFMHYAFRTFDALVHHINQFKTKEECITSLEVVKYSKGK
jgi:hypothetical protein